MNPYRFQIEISDRILLAALLGGLDIAIKVSRQSGKTTAVIWTIGFLMRWMPEITERFFSIGFFTPQKEQVKTDRDRLEGNIVRFEKLYGYKILENNHGTIRIGYGDGTKIASEAYVFCVNPTSHPESKTLDMAVVEESHKLRDDIFENDIAPMLTATNGSVIRTGVGVVQHKRFVQVLKSSKLSIVVNADEVIRQKNQAFKETKDPYHLNYEKFLIGQVARFEALGLGGKDSIPYKLNYALIDCIGGKSGIKPEDVEALHTFKDPTIYELPYEWVSIGIDHARQHDYTFIFVIAKLKEWKKPRAIHIEKITRGTRYDEQARTLVALKKRFINTESFAIVPDSTGQGDFMADNILRELGYSGDAKTGDESAGIIRYKFTSQGKDETAKLLLQSIKHALVEFPIEISEDQKTFENELLQLEIHTNGQLMSWAAPESKSETVDGLEPHDDAVAAFCLALIGMEKMLHRVEPSIRFL